MPEIVTLGEAIVDFTYEKKDEGIFYKQNPGGSPANNAAAAERIGFHSAYIGKIGSGIFGDYIYSSLSELGIDTSGIIRDKERLTSLAFIRTGETGKRNYSFYRSDTADKNLRYNEINKHLIDGCKILHFGALLLGSEPSRSSITNAVEYAKEKGKIISYALNFREPLWNDRDEAAIAMRSVLGFTDILKVSEEELEILSDSSNLLPSIYKLMKYGIKVLIVTQGAKGCIIATGCGIREVRSYKTPIVDTLGSGDSFLGAFLSRVARQPKIFEECDFGTLGEFARYANAAGAVCASKIGAIPAMPTDAEIRNCMEQNPQL
jgi:fructokinase